MRFEEQYEDVLKEIETAIVRVFRAHRDLTGHGVMRVLEAVIDSYAAEKVGWQPRDFRLTELERELHEAIRAVTQRWRAPAPVAPGAAPGAATTRTASAARGPPAPGTLRVDEVVQCLKRLMRSAKLWTNEGGRQGYLNFVSQYLK